MGKTKKKAYQNKNAKKKAPLSPEQSAKRTRKIIIVVISIIVGIALILGAVLGIIAGVKNASYVMKLNKVGINEGVASFLISTFKYDYMEALVESGVDVKDTNEFWNRNLYTGTQGDLFNYEAENYLKWVIAAVAMFDEYCVLTDADKRSISLGVDEILNHKASGSEDTFNSLTEGMGFDFKDFKKGTEMLYKCRQVFVRVFGANGENMSSMFPDYCESEYNSGYARALVLFIRTEDTFVLDENNQLIKEEGGAYKTRLLNEDEKTERAEYIATLDGYVDAINQGSSINAEKFKNLAAEIAGKYNENVTSAVQTGYYFMSGADYTEKFIENGFEDIVSKAFELEIGSAATYESGVTMAEDDSNKASFAYKCYIYRMEKEDKAYKNSSLSHFFTDFYKICAQTLYSEMGEEYSKKVDVRNKWDRINPVAIPYNYDYYVKEFE